MVSLLIGSAVQKFLIWLFYEQSALLVVDFELKKFSLGNLTKSFFPIYSWTYSTELRGGAGVYPPNSFCRRKIY